MHLAGISRATASIFAPLPRLDLLELVLVLVSSPPLPLLPPLLLPLLLLLLGTYTA